uniref:putative monothiol glutaredoxin ycf64 like n=1 Tax=Hypnea wynnei TaxID=1867777 RepID=UPI0027DA886D|nr:putative monothiol glutaredoxin ycf64 like [Hypnea wynnei]WCH56469.1 putative monothiol glutaredoxin ycf64 like [Hypnea wynnei]
MDNNLNLTIEMLIQKHPIILFMKGDKNSPKCNFSKQVVDILNTFNIEYHTINLLNDIYMRNEIKIYSQWPTIPQLYINQQFIGGTDIIVDLYKTFKLHEILELHTNS